MAQSAARRHGAVHSRDLEQRARGAIGVQIWKRAARMVVACRPALCADEAAAVLPAAVAQAVAAQRSCPLALGTLTPPASPLRFT